MGSDQDTLDTLDDLCFDLDAHVQSPTRTIFSMMSDDEFDPENLFSVPTSSYDDRLPAYKDECAICKHIFAQLWSLQNIFDSEFDALLHLGLYEYAKQHDEDCPSICGKLYTWQADLHTKREEDETHPMATMLASTCTTTDPEMSECIAETAPPSTEMSNAQYAELYDMCVYEPLSPSDELHPDDSGTMWGSVSSESDDGPVSPVDPPPRHAGIQGKLRVEPPGMNRSQLIEQARRRPYAFLQALEEKLQDEDNEEVAMRMEEAERRRLEQWVMAS